MIMVPMEPPEPPDPEQVERARAEVNAGRHELYSALESLSRDQAEQLQEVFTFLANTGDSRAQCMFWASHMQTLLQLKYKVCPACHKNHDEEAANLDPA